MTLITDHHDGLGLNDLVTIEARDEDMNGVPGDHIRVEIGNRYLLGCEKHAMQRFKRAKL